MTSFSHVAVNFFPSPLRASVGTATGLLWASAGLSWEGPGMTRRPSPNGTRARGLPGQKCRGTLLEPLTPIKSAAQQAKFSSSPSTSPVSPHSEHPANRTFPEVCEGNAGLRDRADIAEVNACATRRMRLWLKVKSLKSLNLHPTEK